MFFCVSAVISPGTIWGTGAAGNTILFGGSASSKWSKLLVLDVFLIPSKKAFIPAAVTGAYLMGSEPPSLPPTEGVALVALSVGSAFWGVAWRCIMDCMFMGWASFGAATLLLFRGLTQQN